MFDHNLGARDRLAQTGDEELFQQIRSVISVLEIELSRLIESCKDGFAGPLLEFGLFGSFGADDCEFSCLGNSARFRKDRKQKDSQESSRQIIHLEYLFVAGVFVDLYLYFQDAGVQNGEVEFWKGVTSSSESLHACVAAQIQLPYVDDRSWRCVGELSAGLFALWQITYSKDEATDT